MEGSKQTGGYFPATRMSLLSDCRSYKNRRWNELYQRYEPSMMRFLKNNFGWLDFEERQTVVNNAFMVLAKELPTFNYPANQQGLFRRFLVAVLRNTAKDYGKKKQKKRQVEIQYSDNDEMLERLRDEDASFLHLAADEREMERQDVIDLTIQGLLADTTFKAQTREVFRRIAVDGDSPQSIADDMGLARSAVDNMKARMMKKFKRCANAMFKEINKQPKTKGDNHGSTD